ncbi:response regulator [Methylobacterium frigidaeris]|nr:response regulator [Methylobacterium frigidaeris]
MAEDEVLLRMEAADLLNDAGFSVLEAGNAEGALRYLERHPEVQLLFTDVQMPGACDGFALAREVARRWPHIAIVVVSGAARPAPGELPDKARFFSKPYNPTLVLGTVQELLAA